MRSLELLASVLLVLSCATIAGGDEPPHKELHLVRDVRLEKLIGPGRWEASGVDVVDGQLVVVLDSDQRLVRLDPELTKAELVGEEKGHGSDFEDLAWDPQEKRLWVVVEEARHDDGTCGPLLVEFDHDLKRVGEPVRLPLTTTGENKGIEGLAFLRRKLGGKDEPPGGREVLLCLFEGNHGLSGKQGKDKGHGVIGVLGRTAQGWEKLATLELPPQVAFTDYAGIDLEGERLAIVSQASAEVWIGRLAPDAWKVVDAGKIYALPAGFDRCEGIAWLDTHHLAMCSDAAKPDESAAHDQSVHVFEIPE